jgi:hypothetical protein
MKHWVHPPEVLRIPILSSIQEKQRSDFENWFLIHLLGPISEFRYILLRSDVNSPRIGVKLCKCWPKRCGITVKSIP